MGSHCAPPLSDPSARAAHELARSLPADAVPVRDAEDYLSSVGRLKRTLHIYYITVYDVLVLVALSLQTMSQSRAFCTYSKCQLS
jgi:hypothetical protein